MRRVYVRVVQSVFMSVVMLNSLSVLVWLGVQFQTIHSTGAHALSGTVHNMSCVPCVRAGCIPGAEPPVAPPMIQSVVKCKCVRACKFVQVRSTDVHVLAA